MAVSFSKEYFRIDPVDYVDGKRVPLQDRRDLRAVVPRPNRYKTRAQAMDILKSLPEGGKDYQVAECFDVCF